MAYFVFGVFQGIIMEDEEYEQGTSDFLVRANSLVVAVNETNFSLRESIVGNDAMKVQCQFIIAVKIGDWSNCSYSDEFVLGKAIDGEYNWSYIYIDPSQYQAIITGLDYSYLFSKCDLINNSRDRYICYSKNIPDIDSRKYSTFNIQHQSRDMMFPSSLNVELNCSFDLDNDSCFDNNYYFVSCSKTGAITYRHEVFN